MIEQAGFKKDCRVVQGNEIIGLVDVGDVGIVVVIAGGIDHPANRRQVPVGIERRVARVVLVLECEGSIGLENGLDAESRRRGIAGLGHIEPGDHKILET